MTALHTHAVVGPRTASPATGQPVGERADGQPNEQANEQTSDQTIEQSTREHVLRLVVAEGPVSVVELARGLHLTTAGVRRHVAALEEAGLVVVHAGAPAGPAGRGRPARRFVASQAGQAALASSYADLAGQALRFLVQTAGPDAVRDFAEHRAAALEAGLAALVDPTAPAADRVAQLAAGLAREGYASSVRPVPGGRAVQLCQGHCPVQDVAAEFPAFCEAESQMISRVLGVHVQRLSTLAAGGHVCTTHVPVAAIAVAEAPEGSEGRPSAMEGQR